MIEACKDMKEENDGKQKSTKCWPRLRSTLIIGGGSKEEQLKPFNENGCHIVVATPGRLGQYLKTKTINLQLCKYICLDEADRMLDKGFDEQVEDIIKHFPVDRARQTVLLSATMPQKFQDFAEIGRAHV